MGVQGCLCPSPLWWKLSALCPAALRPATLRPAALRPAALRPATLRPATLRPATLRPGLLPPRSFSAVAVSACHALWICLSTGWLYDPRGQELESVLSMA